MEDCEDEFEICNACGVAYRNWCTHFYVDHLKFGRPYECYLLCPCGEEFDESDIASLHLENLTPDQRLNHEVMAKILGYK